MFFTKSWLKSLANIDASWMAVRDETDGTYSIVKEVAAKVPVEGGRMAIIHGPRTVAVFSGEPCEAHLDELRRRKRLGEQLKIVENPLNELKYYADMNKEAKAKKHELAIEMMAEGFMKRHKMATSLTFVMPGEKKETRSGERHHDEPEVVVAGHGGGSEGGGEQGPNPPSPVPPSRD